MRAATMREHTTWSRDGKSWHVPREHRSAQPGEVCPACTQSVMADATCTRQVIQCRSGGYAFVCSKHHTVGGECRFMQSPRERHTKQAVPTPKSSQRKSRRFKALGVYWVWFGKNSAGQARYKCAEPGCTGKLSAPTVGKTAQPGRCVLTEAHSLAQCAESALDAGASNIKGWCRPTPEDSAQQASLDAAASCALAVASGQSSGHEAYASYQQKVQLGLCCLRCK